MPQSLLVVILLCTASKTLSSRIFRVTNNCDQKLWFGIQGIPLLYGGGFEVNSGGSLDLSVPDGWVSGRIWPRTGCRTVDGKFVCATGDCGAPLNGFGLQCNGIGGQPPATIAEFTLDGWGGSDYYDLSNVDGHSIGMTIRPIPGQYTMVNNPSLGKYNCGTATCTFDASKCPPELQMDDGTGHLVCASICAAIHNAQQRAKHLHLRHIYDNRDTRALVCCSCDGDYCVSPHDNVTPGRKCYVEQWPRSTQNTRYDEVFKSQCPDAYSWQFDDFASTYQCSKANYEIILCPAGSPVTGGPNPTTNSPIPSSTTQPSPPPSSSSSSSGNICNGQMFDTSAYWCDGGRLCSKGERACGFNPHACYKETMYQCINNQLRPVK